MNAQQVADKLFQQITSLYPKGPPIHGACFGMSLLAVALRIIGVSQGYSVSQTAKLTEQTLNELKPKLIALDEHTAKRKKASTN